MRKAIVVLGMHRSGTSAITRVLSLLGADLPTHLMAPGFDNETGFWESDDLRNLHDEMLGACRSSYDDVLALSESLLGSTAVAEFRERILALLRRDFERSALFVIKDPRICRFVPFWLSLLNDFGAEPHIVLCVRNPLEVAASLKKRNGFSTSKSLLLWLRHTFDAERGTRGLRRTVVFYDDLLRDWRKVAERISSELEIDLSPSNWATAEIESFLSPQARHHQIARSELSEREDVASWVRNLFASMSKPAALTAEAAQLDALSRQYGEAEDLWGQIVIEQRLGFEQQQLRFDEQQLHLNQRITEIAQALSNKEGKVQALENHLTERRRSLDRLSREVATLRAALDAREGEIEALGERLSERTQDAEKQSDDLASLRATLAVREAELAGMRQRLDRAPDPQTIPRRASLARRVITRPFRRSPQAPPPVGVLSRLPLQQVVQMLYSGVLGREPDEAGMRHHVTLLGAGEPMQNLVRAFVDSREFEVRLRGSLQGSDAKAASPVEIVAAAYRTILGREPEPAELALDGSSIQTGGERSRIFTELVDSEEFVDYVTQTPIEQPTMDCAVSLGTDGFFLMGRIATDDGGQLQLALNGNRLSDVASVSYWPASEAVGDPRRRRFMAMVPAPGALDPKRTDIKWRAPNGRFYTAAGPAPILDPALGRRAILESFSAEELVPERLEFAHRAIAGLTERCQARVSVRRVFSVGAPPSRPRLSIIVPLYKRLDFVEHQLAQFAGDPDFSTAELIFVLDSPEQENHLEALLHQLLAIYEIPMHVVVMTANAGYSAANNAGAYLAKGTLLVLLNSDVIPVRHGWLKDLADFHDGRNAIGALGPKLLYEDESLQHAGMYFSRNHNPSSPWHNAHYFKGFHRDFPGANVARPVPAVTGACLMIRRDLFHRIGGLQEQYVQGNFEDSDLCLKCIRDGYENWYLPTVELFHLEGQSLRCEDSSWRRASFAYNCWLHSKLWDDHIASLMRRMSEAS